MAKKKKWGQKVGPHGATVWAREDKWGGNVYLFSWDPQLGGERKRSLRFKVRDAEGRLLEEATKEALKKARELSNRLIVGENPHRTPVTVGELFDGFRRDEVDAMDGKHEAETRRALECWERYLGRRFEVARFSIREWNAFRRARESGAIDGRGNAVEAKKRRKRTPGTAGKDMKVLRQACRYGARVRRPDGGFLLDVDPTRGLEVPTNPNPARPVADDALLEALLTAAEKQSTGRGRKAVRTPLRELLILAAYSGRRISAILGLRWSDWRPEEGTYGSLRWRADTDKLGRETVVPVHPKVRDALETWRQERPGVGEGWVFPAPASDGPIDATLAERWLKKAEKAAGIKHVRGFGFHAFRRMWATKRKGLPLQDVAAAGGWKGTQVLRDLYQQPDPETLEAVVLGGRELRMGTDG